MNKYDNHYVKNCQDLTAVVKNTDNINILVYKLLPKHSVICRERN